MSAIAAPTRFVIAAVLLAVLAATQAQAAGPCGTRRIDTPVRVGVTNAPTVYDDDLTGTELAWKMRNTPHGLDGHTMGLTEAKFFQRIKVQFHLWQAGAVWCAEPQSIDVDLGYDQMLVHVDRKYHTWECQRRVVLEHENTHVRINLSSLDEYLPRIRQDAAQTVRAFPLAGNDAQQVQQQGMATIQNAVVASLQRMLRARDARHAQLDSPASYRASNAQCPAW